MRTGLAATLAVAGLAAVPAMAQPQSDPDWPCVQRLVPELTAAQMWSGPSLDAVEGFWQADALVAPLVLKLVDIDADDAQVEAAIDAFVQAVPEAERADRLTMLFKAALETVNGERADMIRVIKRYAERQRALADRISADNAQLRDIRLDAAPEDIPPELREIKERRDWDLRVFDDRTSMLALICEQPVMIEQRAFALARSIQGRLP